MHAPLTRRLQGDPQAYGVFAMRRQAQRDLPGPAAVADTPAGAVHDAALTALFISLGTFFFGLSSLIVITKRTHMPIFIVMIWMHATHHFEATPLTARSLDGCKALVAEMQKTTDSTGVVYACRKGWLQP